MLLLIGLLLSLLLLVFANLHLLLHFAILSKLLLDLFVGRGGLDAEVEVSGASGVSEWWSVIASFDVVGDEVTGIDVNLADWEVPGTGPALSWWLGGTIPDELGHLAGLTINGVMQGDLAESEVRVFGFDEEWDDGVGGDFEVSCGVKESDNGRLIQSDINWVCSGIWIRLAVVVGDVNAIEFGERAIFAGGEFPFGGELVVIDGDGNFFAFFGEFGVI